MEEECKVCGKKTNMNKEEIEELEIEIQKIEEKFYKELVEMSPLKGRDMHNRPPLYDTPDEKIEEIKQFIKQALQEQRQSILEEIEKKIDDMGFVQPEQAGQFGLHASGYNQALEDIKEILKDNKE